MYCFLYLLLSTSYTTQPTPSPPPWNAHSCSPDGVVGEVLRTYCAQVVNKSILCDLEHMPYMSPNEWYCITIVSMLVLNHVLKAKQKPTKQKGCQINAWANQSTPSATHACVSKWDLVWVLWTRFIFMMDTNIALEWMFSTAVSNSLHSFFFVIYTLALHPRCWALAVSGIL